jgi:hypothetical protein
VNVSVELDDLTAARPQLQVDPRKIGALPHHASQRFTRLARFRQRHLLACPALIRTDAQDATQQHTRRCLGRRLGIARRCTFTPPERMRPLTHSRRKTRSQQKPSQSRNSRDRSSKPSMLNSTESCGNRPRTQSRSGTPKHGLHPQPQPSSPKSPCWHASPRPKSSPATWQA